MRVLVAGDARHRAELAARLEEMGAGAIEDADPELGDAVVFVRLEGRRYDAIVFLGHSDPVTRGALAAAAEKAVFIPLVDEPSELDARRDGYLFRLPRAIGFRDEREQRAVRGAVERAADVPSELVGPRLDREQGLRRLLKLTTEGRWRWAELEERVAAEAEGAQAQ